MQECCNINNNNYYYYYVFSKFQGAIALMDRNILFICNLYDNNVCCIFLRNVTSNIVKKDYFSFITKKLIGIPVVLINVLQHNNVQHTYQR